MAATRIAKATDQVIAPYGKRIAIEQAVKIALDTFTNMHEVQLTYLYSTGGGNFKDPNGSLYFISPMNEFCKGFEQALKDKGIINKITFLPANFASMPRAILTKKYSEI